MNTKPQFPVDLADLIGPGIELTKIRHFNELAIDLKSRNYPVISLELGQPGFPSPLENTTIIGAGPYPSFKGAPHFQEAISQYLRELVGVDIVPQNITPTGGGSNAIYYALDVLGNREVGRNSVLLFSPYFENTRSQIDKQGLDCRTVSLRNRGNSLIASVRATLQENPNIATAVVVSPSNPAGTVFSKKELINLAEVFRECGVFVVDDQAYAGMVFSNIEYHSISEFYESSIICGSISKIGSSAGARAGWAAIVNEEVANMEFLNLAKKSLPTQLKDAIPWASYCTSPCTSGPIQTAASIFLEHEATNPKFTQLSKVTKGYEQRVHALQEVFTDFGWTLPYGPPEGAFYLMVSNEEHGSTGLDQSKWLISQLGIVSSPGEAFGAEVPCVRLCASKATSNLVSKVRTRFEKITQT